MKITAKRDVSKAITRDRRNPVPSWPAGLPKMALTIIRIVYAVINGEGERIECWTWSAGSTSRVALRKWLNTRPEPAKEDFTYTVLAEPHVVHHACRDVLGKRVEVTDTLAEYLAATSI